MIEVGTAEAMRSGAFRYWVPIALFGVAVFLIAQPTYIGWWVYDHALGEPVWHSRWWSLYEPHDAVRWWWLYGDDPTFMAVFWNGVERAAWIAFFAVCAAGYAVHINAPMPAVAVEEQPHRYGTVDDLLDLGRVSLDRRGIVIGRWGKTPVYHTGDDHVVVVGTSRVGEKDTAFVSPTIVDCLDSLVIFDPKGTSYAATADERRKYGPVWLFDASQAGSSKFNPLQELRGGDLNIDDCEMMGQLMTYGMDHNADPFWRLQAARLIAGLVREACLMQPRPTFDRVLDTFQALRLKKIRPAVPDKWVQRRVATFLALEERPRSGAASQVDLALQFTENTATMQALSRSQWQVSDLCSGPDPVTVYLTFPPSQMGVHTQLIRVVLQSLFVGMLHHPAQAADGRRKTRRVTWIINEFPELGHLPFIEKAMAMAAEYGVKMFLVCQDINQIERVYGRNQSILNNCGHVVFSTLSDSGYEYATKMCGTMIAPMRARHRKIGIIDRQSETASQSRHPVLNPREARLLTRNEALVLSTVGAKPVWLPKCRWWAMKHFKGRIKDTRWMEGP